MKLIEFYRAPAVCALEYDEQRDLERNPKKASHYADLIKKRTAEKKRKK